MAISRLFDISMEKTCCNLYLNSEICKKNHWKIPTSIGGLIFEFYLKGNLFNKRDFLFFDKNITSISKLKLTEKHLNSIDIFANFDFESIKCIELASSAMLKQHSLLMLSQYLSNCEKIESINLRKNIFTVIGFGPFCKQISKSSKTLKKINLSFCHLNSYQIHCLNKLIGKCEEIEEINILGNSYRSSEFHSFLIELSNSAKSLKKLTISSKKFSSQNASILSKFFRETPQLERLKLRMNLSKKCQRIFNSQLKLTTSLTKIKLVNCGLTELDGLTFGKFLKCCTQIQVFSIKGNTKIGYGLTHICEGLISCSKTLRKLDFSSSLTEIEQYIAIKNLLQECLIQTLILNSNTMLENGLFKILDGLKKSSSSLRVLEFQACFLNEIETVGIGKFLVNCSNLEEVNLSANRAMGHGILEVCNGLKTSKNSLKEFICFYCFFKPYQKFQVNEILNMIQMKKRIF